MTERLLVAAVVGLALIVPAHATAQGGVLLVEPGARLGAIRIGMGHAELADLELAHRPPGPGRPAHYGHYRVVFAAGTVQRVGVRLGDAPIRANGRVVRHGAALRDVLAAFRHCVHRARGGVECDGNGVRVAPSEESPGDVEVWVQARREPLVVAPGVQLGPVRIGMSEEELRALAGPPQETTTVVQIDGVNAHLEDGRVVRARAELARWGRMRVGDAILDEGAPAAERDRRLGCARRSPEAHPTCPGVTFAHRAGSDEEVVVEAPRARPRPAP